MRVCVLARHGQSVLNVEGRVNGDPRVDVELTEEGRAQAARLGVQLANVAVELCAHSRFERALHTASIAMQGRSVPFAEQALLDDIDVGTLEGEGIDAYRAWKAAHSRLDLFPGGESFEHLARRYAQAARWLVSLSEDVVVAVCHEIGIRCLLNAAAGEDPFDGPVHDIDNATPFLFDGAALERAASTVEQRR